MTPHDTTQGSDLDITEPPGGAFERSPADVLRLVVAGAVLVVLVLLAIFFGDTLVEFLTELLAGISAIPTWILQILVGGIRIAAVVAFVWGFVYVVRQGEWRFLLRVAVAGVMGAGLCVALLLLLPEAGTAPAEDIVAPGFPTTYGLAVIAAVVTAAAPWMERGHRRWAWALVLALAFAQFVSTPVSLDVVIAVLAGWVAGAAALVVLGGPNRRPSAHSIADGLTAVGLDMVQLAPLSVDARGSTPYLGTLSDGRRVFVKALGDDQRSADLLFRLYRKATRRQLGDERPFSSLRRAVEHEGLVSLAAAGQGVCTPAYLAMGHADPNGFALAFDAVDGKSLDSVPAEQMTDQLLDACWEQVAILRRHRTAHRDLRLANLFRRADGTVLLIDFGFGELAAADLLLNTDVAELLASTATSVGPERAVASAERVIGIGALRAAVPRLDPSFLSGATRTALAEQPAVLHRVRGLLAPR